MPKQIIPIRGMHCRSCELLLEEDLGQVAGVAGVVANFRKGEVELTYAAAPPDRKQIASVVQKAGYQVGRETAWLPWFSKQPADYTRLLFAMAVSFLAFFLFQAMGWTRFTDLGQVDPAELSLILLIGLTAGVSTCAALVGGLVLAVSARYNTAHPELTFGQRLVPHAWFHAGRIGGFFFFGVLLGFLGDWLGNSIGFTALLTLLAGGVMLLLGIQLSGISPRMTGWNFTLPKRIAQFFGVMQVREERYTHRGALVGGALTFFLPCGFTQAVQLAVVALGQPLWGGVVMAIFALGTVPGLLALGGLATVFSTRAKMWLYPVLAVLLVVFGGWNLSNGLQLFGITTPALVVDDARPTAPLAPLENGVQVVRMVQDELGYHPATLPTLRLGVPARLIINSENSYTCASSLVIPEFGIKRQLQPGENIIEFTPMRSGRLPFSCSMGMFRGSLEVQ